MRAGMIGTLVAAICVVAASAQTPADRTRAMTQYRLGMDLLRDEAWQEAVRAFLRAIDIDPSMALAHYGLGKAYMGMKDFGRAIKALTACRDRYRGEIGARMSGEWDRHRQGQDQILELNQILREYQRLPPTLRNQRAMMQIQDQIRDLERQLNQSGGSMNMQMDVPAFVSLALGSAYFRNSDLEEAERYYTETIKTNPNIGEAHNNLAVVYLMTDRIDAADRAVKQAEKAGYRVNPQLKEEIKAAKRQ